MWLPEDDCALRAEIQSIIDEIVRRVRDGEDIRTARSSVEKSRLAAVRSVYGVPSYIHARNHLRSLNDGWYVLQAVNQAELLASARRSMRRERFAVWLARLRAPLSGLFVR